MPSILKVFGVFVVLQIADLGTTIAALLLDGVEANPLVRHLMTFGLMEGLVLSKLICLAIGVLCLLGRRHRALHLANLVFTGVVTWNTVAVATLLV